MQYNYIISNKLTQNDHFKNAKNQRMFTLNTTNNILVADGVGFPTDYCCNDHSVHKIQQMITWASTNSLLNNFCQKENDLIVINKCNANNDKKRKLQTLSK